MEFICINAEVKAALRDHKPIVALESTIISHGMPYPQNVQTAKLLEETVRENGAIPATIAVLDGVIRIGLEAEDIEKLGTSNNIAKASRKDLPVYLSQKRSAATTVSATMICAHKAGIKFFATGGIGGVHRGAEKSFDISADLEEFATTPVLVVSAGPKAILDIPATMEYLETKGVPVLGFGCDQVPAFYYSESGVKIQHRVDSPAAAAEVFWSSLNLGFNCGILVGNPVKKEFSLEKLDIEGCIEKALLEAKEKEISGQELTPFLLQRLFEITGGNSLATNIELVKSNAALCAQIAVKFYELGK